MPPTTIRLPEDTLEQLDAEYADYGYGSRSDYIRAIIEHREPPFADTSTTGDYGLPTTEDYNRLRERVDQLEDRLADLETDDGREVVSFEPEPQGSDVETDVVGWVREHQPVSRSDIVDAFEHEWSSEGIKGDSWWRRHARPALEEDGFSYVRNVGWQVR